MSPLSPLRSRAARGHEDQGDQGYLRASALETQESARSTKPRRRRLASLPVRCAGPESQPGEDHQQRRIFGFSTPGQRAELWLRRISTP